MSDQAQGGVPKHFIVIVPGYMGSQLRDRASGKMIWGDFKSIPMNPFKWDSFVEDLFNNMRYPNENLEPAGIINEVVVALPWVKLEQYGRLVAALEGMGYRADPAKYPEEQRQVYCFDYDWRQDNRLSGRQLGQAIERWSAHHPGAKAWLIGHSNGGIVSRWYIEKEGGKERAGKLILMGSPWDGAPKAVRMLYGGLDTLLRPGLNLFKIKERSLAAIRSFPSAYQLVPVHNPFLRDVHNEAVDVFESAAGWLEEEQQRRYLEDGRRFNEELGTTLSVETICFFGRKLPTQSGGVLRTAAGGRWSGIDWTAAEAGDGTVPERSAVHPQATARLPFVANHGDIYVNPAALEFLEWELLGKYQQPDLGERASISTERLTVIFEPTRDVYAPGEEIPLWARITRNKDGSPVSGARIAAVLAWREALPGDEAPAATPKPSQGDLWEDENEPGRYTGSLAAPGAPGYYQVRATVNVTGESPILAEELVVVEATPDG